LPGYRPVEPSVVKQRTQLLNDRFTELKELAEQRRLRLEDNRRLCQFFLDVEELEQGFKEMSKLLSSPDIGHDVTSVHLLLSKHKASFIFSSTMCMFMGEVRMFQNVEDNMASMERNMKQVIDNGRQLIDEGIPGNEQILSKIAELEDEWDQLRQMADARKQRLIGGVDYYQVPLA